MRTITLFTVAAASVLLFGCGKQQPEPAKSQAPETAQSQAAAPQQVPQYSAETFFNTTTLYGSSMKAMALR